MNNIQLYLGKSEEILKQIPDNSVDLINTDPPYGYSFMGKSWDKVVVPTSTWKECLRVLKPGAFAFIMSAPRQDVLSRMIYNLQEAGFETGFSSIYYTYATGFPKASNIAKKVDKRLGIKSKIIGQGKSGKSETHKSSYQMAQDQNNKFGGEYKITEAVSPQAKELDGSYGGFQPKPSVEIVIVAMKPLSEKTYVDQALKNGHGITHLDNCRIPHNEEQKETKRQSRNENQTFSNKSCGFKSENLTTASASPKGRFPANLLVSDDVLNDGKISKGTIRKPTGKKILNSDDGWNQNKMEDKTVRGQNDSGSYSRYFDLDKWWIERIKKLPESVQKVFPYLIVPKASKREKNKGCERLENETYLDESRHDKEAIGCNNPRNRTGKSKKGNNHPTVKPIKLMSYLITLGSREGEIILDPFMGSGTTGIASKLLNRKFIGIEMSEEYIKIAQARIKGNNKEV